MNFDEWMQGAYECFGPEAMAVFDKYVLGEINYDTWINNMTEAAINFHMQNQLRRNSYDT